MEIKGNTLTGILSTLTAIAVAFLGYWGNHKIESLNSDLKQQEIDLLKEKFKEQIAIRKETNLKEYIPKMVSEDKSERNIGRAVIFSLYPNEAVNILTSIEKAITDSSAKDEAKVAKKQAEKLNTEIGEWIIITGGDKTLDAAQYEVNKAKNEGYKQVSIYYRNNYYRTVIGPFGSKDDASLELIEIKHRLNKSAYVVNQNSWCKSSTKENGFIQCE